MIAQKEAKIDDELLLSAWHEFRDGEGIVFSHVLGEYPSEACGIFAAGMRAGLEHAVDGVKKLQKTA